MDSRVSLSQEDLQGCFQEIDEELSKNIRDIEETSRVRQENVRKASVCAAGSRVVGGWAWLGWSIAAAYVVYMN